MVEVKLTLEQYGQNGDKTGWTFALISSEIAQAIKPDTKVSFRVKGIIDHMPVAQISLLPLGNGTFCLPFNAQMRKTLRKREGDTVMCKLAHDDSPVEISPELLDCLVDDAAASSKFDSLTKGHQRYFSKWIEDAKTIETKSRRIAVCLEALGKGLDYPAMMRLYRTSKS